MKVPRVRFTMRLMMVAAAVVGTVLGLAHWFESRAAWLRARRDFHSDRWTLTIVEPRGEDGRVTGPLQVTEYGGRPVDGLRARRELWNYRMFKKYIKAAENPWLPVEPDPPEPK
jgi:hypothetical protein